MVFVGSRKSERTDGLKSKSVAVRCTVYGCGVSLEVFSEGSKTYHRRFRDWVVSGQAALAHEY